MTPAAATDAWLRQISAATLAAGEHHARSAALAWALGVLLPLAAAWLMARVGLLQRAGLWGARRGPWLSWLAAISAFSVLSCLVETILAAVAMARAWDPSGLAAAVVLRLTLLAALYGLLRLAGSRPRLGFALTAFAASFALVFGPTLLGELTRRPDHRSPPEPIAAAALALARASGVAATNVELTDGAGGEGDVVGLLRAPRILVADSPGLPRAEILAKVGHVLGHYRARDQFAWAVLLGLLGAGWGVFVADLVPVAARMLGIETRIILPFLPAKSKSAAVGVTLSDVRALPALWVLTAIWLAVATPAAFAFDRYINLRADRFSLDHAREPDGLAAALVRENGLAPVDPPALERWIVCSHPPLKARIAQAMAWKAASRR